MNPSVKADLDPTVPTQESLHAARRASTVHDTLLVLQVRALISSTSPDATASPDATTSQPYPDKSKLVTSISISQHKHVYTIGKRPNEHNILATEHELRACGAEVHKTRRGGDVTYHGPGQFVLYPVINLRDAKVGARAYVEGLEDLMIDCAKGFGVQAKGRVPGMTGVWVGEKKLGAVGVRISQGVTSHGLAMNHRLDTEWFDRIVPCGLEGRAVTTLEHECDAEYLEHEAVQARLVECFAGRFGYDDVRVRRVDAGGSGAFDSFH